MPRVSTHVLDAVSGRPVPKNTPPPREVGVMCVITAETQDLATQMAKARNPYFFHMPLFDGIELPSYGFPFTPADVARGQVFEFKLNHVVELDDPLELVSVTVVLEAAEVQWQ